MKFHPKIDSETNESHYNEFDKSNYKTFTQTYDYILVPDYDILEQCRNCELKESENFYPFHKFNFAFGTRGYDNYSQNYYRNETIGFVGIFGFYGHTEFMFYVIIPLLILGLSIVYRKFVK